MHQNKKQKCNVLLVGLGIIGCLIFFGLISWKVYELTPLDKEEMINDSIFIALAYNQKDYKDVYVVPDYKDGKTFVYLTTDKTFKTIRFDLLNTGLGRDDVVTIVESPDGVRDLKTLRQVNKEDFLGGDAFLNKGRYDVSSFSKKYDDVAKLKKTLEPYDVHVSLEYGNDSGQLLIEANGYYDSNSIQGALSSWYKGSVPLQIVRHDITNWTFHDEWIYHS